MTNFNLFSVTAFIQKHDNCHVFNTRKTATLPYINDILVAKF